MISRGSWAAVLVLVGAAFVGLDAGSAVASPNAERAPTAVFAASPYDPVCGAAAAVAKGDPQEAIKIIEDLRDGEPTDAPMSRERLRSCAEELDAAIASASLESDYCSILQALEGADALDEALALVGIRAVPTDCSASEWIDEEKAKAEDGFPPATSGIESAWDEFVETTLDPLAGVSAFVLAAWGALLVLARLLVFPFRNPVTSRDDRLGVAAMGFGFIVLGPLVFVQGVNAGHSVGLILGGAISLAGSALVGRWLSALPKLIIEVTGKADTGLEVGLVSAVLRDMGGDAGRGLEIPVGPDVTALEASVAELSKNAWIAVAQKVILFVTNIKPWRIDVHMESRDLAYIQVGRNGREIASERLDAGRARVTEKADEANCTDPQRLAAQASAFVIATMATRYPADFRPGLYGATKWQGIALQYIVTSWYKERSDQANAVELLQRAVAEDPANRIAELSHRKFRHRFATDVDELLEYGLFLKRAIEDLDARGEREQYNRSVIAYLAAWRNWTAVRAAAAPTAQRDAWWKLDGELTKLDLPRPEENWLRSVAAQRSVELPRGQAGEVDQEERRAIAAIDLLLLRMTTKPKGSAWGGDLPAVVDRMASSPFVAYSIGCALARLNLDVEQYRKYLAAAARDKEIAAWARTEDPELERVRSEAWFTEVFGLEPEPELTYAPFTDYREKLGVTRRADLLTKTWTSKLNVDLVLFDRLKAAAELSIRAERLDAQVAQEAQIAEKAQAAAKTQTVVPVTRALGRDARMVAVRHLFERRVNPLCGHASIDVDALLERLRDVGYCGSRDELAKWIERVKTTSGAAT